MKYYYPKLIFIFIGVPYYFQQLLYYISIDKNIPFYSCLSMLILGTALVFLKGHYTKYVFALLSTVYVIYTNFYVLPSETRDAVAIVYAVLILSVFVYFLFETKVNQTLIIWISSVVIVVMLGLTKGKLLYTFTNMNSIYGQIMILSVNLLVIVLKPARRIKRKKLKSKS